MVEEYSCWKFWSLQIKIILLSIAVMTSKMFMIWNLYVIFTNSMCLIILDVILI
jgi:hypothetical protein